MRKKIMLSILIIISTLSQSSAQCKFKTNKIDPFTKQKVIGTDMLTLMNKFNGNVNKGSKSVDVMFNNVNDTLMMCLVYGETGIAWNIKEASFLFEDESVSVYNKFYYTAKITGGGNWQYSTNNYFIKDEDLPILLSKHLKSIQLIMESPRDNILEFEISKQKSEQFIQMITCIKDTKKS